MYVKFKKLKEINIIQRKKNVIIDNISIIENKQESIKEEKQTMDTQEAIELLSKLENGSQNVNEKTAKVKRINKPIDGLFERTESSKIILTENNKQVLTD